MVETPKTNARIEELRGRLAADPKSRLFYPLAEELRKVGEFAEAEKVLRGGLEVHASYLSAWISLGRVLKELARFTEGIEVLDRAMSLDPGNVVAARLLADCHLGDGNRTEALKKYKLVRALHPADEELDELIDRLEGETGGTGPAETERMMLPPRAAVAVDAEGGTAAVEQPPAAPSESTEPSVATEAVAALDQVTPEVPGAISSAQESEAGPVEPATATESPSSEEPPLAGLPPSPPPPSAETASLPTEDLPGEALHGESPEPSERIPPSEGDESPFDVEKDAEGEASTAGSVAAQPVVDRAGAGSANRARIERLERWLEKIRSRSA